MVPGPNGGEIRRDPARSAETARSSPSSGWARSGPTSSPGRAKLPGAARRALRRRRSGAWAAPRVAYMHMHMSHAHVHAHVHACACCMCMHVWPCWRANGRDRLDLSHVPQRREAWSGLGLRLGLRVRVRPRPLRQRGRESPLGSAAAQLLRLLRARLAAPGSAALTPTERWAGGPLSLGLGLGLGLGLRLGLRLRLRLGPSSGRHGTSRLKARR